MKTKRQKQKEALTRAGQYRYSNSKAHRKGITEGAWLAAHEARISHLRGLINGKLDEAVEAMMGEDADVAKARAVAGYNAYMESLS